jgi:predicted nucleic acid-binding protein
VLIVDTGFLFALVDRRDTWHARAAALAGTAAEGWITTWSSAIWAARSPAT